MSIKFISLRMINFMPFKDEQSLAFGNERPLVIIHGENMTGKSSIFNAIRWVWYGKALDRHDLEIKWSQLVNKEAAIENDYTTRVDLEFEVDEVEYNLTRHIQVKNPNARPTNNSDFDQHLYLQENHRSLPQHIIQPKLNELLPESIAEFFLFDGERLNRYEELVMDNRTQAIAIQSSIEKILGVPALRNGIDDIQINLDSAARRQRTAAAHEQSNQAAVEQALRCEELIENCRSEIDKLEKDLQQIKAERYLLNKTG